MNERKKVRPNLKRLSEDEIKALTHIRIRPLGRLTDKEYKEMWCGNPPKQTEK